MASIKTLMQTRIDQLDQSLEELRSQVDDGDFGQMTATTDRISEQADKLSAKLEQISNAASDDEDEGQGEGEQANDKQRQKAAKT